VNRVNCEERRVYKGADLGLDTLKVTRSGSNVRVFTSILYDSEQNLAWIS